MSDDQIREYVADYLHTGTDWHTEQLTQAQVSGVINALRAHPQQAQGGDTTPPKNWGDE